MVLLSLSSPAGASPGGGGDATPFSGSLPNGLNVDRSAREVEAEIEAALLSSCLMAVDLSVLRNRDLNGKIPGMKPPPLADNSALLFLLSAFSLLF